MFKYSRVVLKSSHAPSWIPPAQLSTGRSIFDSRIGHLDLTGIRSNRLIRKRLTPCSPVRKTTSRLVPRRLVQSLLTYPHLGLFVGAVRVDCFNGSYEWIEAVDLTTVLFGAVTRLCPRLTAVEVCQPWYGETTAFAAVLCTSGASLRTLSLQEVNEQGHAVNALLETQVNLEHLVLNDTGLVNDPRITFHLKSLELSGESVPDFVALIGTPSPPSSASPSAVTPVPRVSTSPPFSTCPPSPSCIVPSTQWAPSLAAASHLSPPALPSATLSSLTTTPVASISLPSLPSSTPSTSPLAASKSSSFSPTSANPVHRSSGS